MDDEASWDRNTNTRRRGILRMVKSDTAISCNVTFHCAWYGIIFYRDWFLFYV